MLCKTPSKGARVGRKYWVSVPFTASINVEVDVPDDFDEDSFDGSEDLDQHMFDLAEAVICEMTADEVGERMEGETALYLNRGNVCWAFQSEIDYQEIT